MGSLCALGGSVERSVGTLADHHCTQKTYPAQSAKTLQSDSVCQQDSLLWSISFPNLHLTPNSVLRFRGQIVDRPKCWVALWMNESITPVTEDSHGCGPPTEPKERKRSRDAVATRFGQCMAMRVAGDWLANDGDVGRLHWITSAVDRSERQLPVFDERVYSVVATLFVWF